MKDKGNRKYVSRGGDKLEYALKEFHIGVTNLVCADFGCSTGGFTEILLKAGAKKVFAVDTGYGVLAWGLRNDPRVVVLERTNAMHVKLPEKCDLITVDVSWTKQKFVLPNVLANLKGDGDDRVDGKIISLVKPHYEAEKSDLVKGRVLDNKLQKIIVNVKRDIEDVVCRRGLSIQGFIESPIVGGKGENKEFLALIAK